MTVYILETADLTAEQQERMMAALPAQRRQQVEQKANALVRRESIAAAYLVFYGLAAGNTDGGLVFLSADCLLSKENGVKALSALVGWPVDNQGKPFVDGLSQGQGRLYVSLSHSEGLAAAVVSKVPVGADIQRIPSLSSRQLMRIALKFHPKEKERLASLSDKEIPAAFCRLWACKESVMKLCGRGLSLPLFSFCIEESNESELDGRKIRIYTELLENAVFAAAEWK